MGTWQHAPLRRIAYIPLSLLALFLPAHSTAQEQRQLAEGGSAIIDTMVVQRQDLFPDSVAASNPFFRLFNELHVTTRPWVILREVLLGKDDVYDSLLAEESERNLRRLGLFRRVRVDTTTLNNQLALRVRTRDAWSLQPRITGRISSDGTFTGSFGVTESNVGGTGNSMRLWYVREADRDGIDMRLVSNRVGATPLAANVIWANLSDRDVISWSVSDPFRSLSGKSAWHYSGRLFRGRILQYRTPDAGNLERREWRRRAQIHRATYTTALRAGPRGYLRVGLAAEHREEAMVPHDNQAIPIDSVLTATPDSTSVFLSAFLDFRRSRFERIRRFNGFAEEDQDLSDRIFVSTFIVPRDDRRDELGYGGRIRLSSGIRAGPAILKGVIDGTGMFNSAGLDSGRVVATSTLALRQGERNTTFLQARGGLVEDPLPGGEFDIGFDMLPRLWGPHAFVGTRMTSVTVEHRAFIDDNFLNLFGLGVGAFLDYGGSWYEDQDRRLGGNVGITVFGGSTLSSFAQVTNLNFGYRFGGGVEEANESRWVFTAGGGIRF